MPFGSASTPAPAGMVEAAARAIADSLTMLGVNPEERPEHGGPTTAETIASEAIRGAARGGGSVAASPDIPPAYWAKADGLDGIRSFLRWLIRLDDATHPQGIEDRRTVTLNQIIGYAQILEPVVEATTATEYSTPTAVAVELRRWIDKLAPATVDEDGSNDGWLIAGAVREICHMLQERAVGLEAEAAAARKTGETR